MKIIQPSWTRSRATLAAALGLALAGFAPAAHAGQTTAIPCPAKAKAVIANTGTSVHNSGSRVQGDVQAAQAINVATSGAVVTGTRTPFTPANLSVVPAPAGATNLGTLVITGARNFTAGNYVASSLTMNSGSSITVSGGVAQIWVTGALVIRGPANNGGAPTNLEFLVTGTQAAHVNSNSQLFGFIYAPAAQVLVDSVVQGSVVGSQVTLNSGGQVLFDAGSSCPVCTPPAVQCGASCVDPQSDGNNCGGCGIVCPGNNTCQQGMCKPAISCGANNPHCILAMSAGDRFTCALISGGTVSCWGENLEGELGNGTVDVPGPGNAHPTPATVPGLSGVTAISSGGHHTCALLAGGAVSCWGDYVTTPTSVPGLSGAIAIASGGLDGAPSPGSTDCVLGPNSHNCAILANGTLTCWGGNYCGELGDGTQVSRPNPVVVPGLTGVVSVAAEGLHTCAILADGTGRCWGANYSGTLGDGTTTFIRTSPVPVLGLTGAASVRQSADHTCTRQSDGTFRCWGDNSFGQVGVPLGSTNSITAPVTVQGLGGGLSVTAGSTFSCALISGGSAACWGSNGFGQLGNGAVSPSIQEPHPLPVTVMGLGGAVALAGGNSHTCALLLDGTAVCWGENAYGQLGNPTAPEAQPLPIPVQF